MYYTNLINIKLENIFGIYHKVRGRRKEEEEKGREGGEERGGGEEREGGKRERRVVEGEE